MTNKQRRSIVDEAKSKGYQGSYIDLFKQAALNPSGAQEVLTADTPLEKKEGLRPQHEAGRTDASMAFTDVPPNTPFNTVGMKAPIDIKKYDEQGHLVKSYENVPPGLTNIDSGPRSGTVLESPARMQEGGFFDNAPYNRTGPRKEIVEPYFTGDDYNYGKALESGETPSPEDGHWGSVAGDDSNVVLKSKDHPTIKHEFIPTMMDPGWKMVGDPEGFFGEDNSMKYVPRMQEGGMTPMTPKTFPSNAERAKNINYAKQIDMAGRLNAIGANTTNEELGLGAADRGKLPLVPNPQLEAAMRNKRIKAQEGATVKPEEEQSWANYLGFNNPQNVTNYVNPFSDLFIPKAVTREIKTRITDNIKPHGYEGVNDESPIQRVKSAVIDNIPERYSHKDMKERGKGRNRAFQERTDLYKMMVGLDQIHNSIEKSEYKPTKGDPNDTYYKSKHTENYIRGKIKDGKIDDIMGVKYHSNYGKINVLGNYTIDQGEDEKGKYVSYYDRWDLNPISNGKKGPAYYAEEAAKAVLGLQGPEVYGRVYYNKGGYRRMQKGGFKTLTDRRKKSSGI